MAFISLLLILTAGTLISILIHKLLKRVMLNELKKRKKRKGLKNGKEAKALRTHFFWGLLICGFLSFLLFQRPLFGLLSLVFGSFLYREISEVCDKSRVFRWEEEVLSFLLTLSGMVRSGLSLPAALRITCHERDQEVIRHVARYLERFGKGKSVKELLEGFVKRSQLRLSAPSLTLLGVVQAEGLEVLPILEKLTQNLQKDIETEKKLRSLRKQVAVQGLGAALLPWGLLIFLWHFQPEMVEAFYGKISGVGLLIFCVFLQVLGGTVLWRISLFR